MSLYAVTFQALAPLFCLILLGYALKKARVLHASHVPIMNGLVVNITFPALIVLGLTRSHGFTSQAALPPALMVLSSLGVQALAYAIGTAIRLSRRSLGTVLIVGSYGNTGFLGYPITLALMPRQFSEAILLDQFGMSLPLYIGAVLISAAFSPSNLHGVGLKAMMAKAFRSPLLSWIFFGLAIRFIPWPHSFLASPMIHGLGAIVVPCLTYLSQATTALILLSLGVSLRPGAAAKNLKPLSLALPMKLLVCPIFMWGLCRVFHVTTELRAVSILLTGMPTSVMGSVLCGQYDLDGDLAVGIVFLTTLCSALTIPLLLSQLR